VDKKKPSEEGRGYFFFGVGCRGVPRLPTPCPEPSRRLSPPQAPRDPRPAFPFAISFLLIVFFLAKDITNTLMEIN